MWRLNAKRVRAADSNLNGSYVSKGVDRFVTSQYASGHDWGFMLGYVLALPASDVVEAIDTSIRKTYGEVAGLTPKATHALSLAVLDGALTQSSRHTIRLKHIFVDMLTAAPVSSA